MAQLTELQIASRKHVAQDMLVASTFGEVTDGEFQGCSIGCIVHEKMGKDFSDEEIHFKASQFYDAPEWWFLLQDTIFEGLPDLSTRGDWHIKAADAVARHNAAKSDWGLTLHRVHAAILRITAKTAEGSVGVVNTVVELHEKAGRGEVVESAAWSAAEFAAWSAADSDARFAADSDARFAARSAAESAAEFAADSDARFAARSAAWSAADSAADSAAGSAAWSAAWSAARSAAYQEISEAIIISAEAPP